MWRGRTHQTYAAHEPAGKEDEDESQAKRNPVPYKGHGVRVA